MKYFVLCSMKNCAHFAERQRVSRWEMEVVAAMVQSHRLRARAEWAELVWEAESGAVMKRPELHQMVGLGWREAVGFASRCWEILRAGRELVWVPVPAAVPATVETAPFHQ